MIDKKTHGKIIAALRKLTFAYPPRNAVKNKQKVAPATYKCESCGDIVYEGKKDLKKAGLEKFPGARKGKMHVDHKYPTIKVEGFSETKWDWNEYIENMFCGKEGLQLLCKSCHDKKSKMENDYRKKFKQTQKESPEYKQLLRQYKKDLKKHI